MTARATATAAAAGGTIIFVGPTLPADEVRARLPGARVAPPAAMGDVLRAARRRGTLRIGLIDGYFERMAAPWHKELLFAIERGVAVYGAASMGALRAAELARFGMIGVGGIYRDYARGALEADDEVAVAHLPAVYGFAATSDALVNLRAGIARAALSPKLRARLIELARARHYRERSWAQLATDAAAAGLPARAVAAIAAIPRVDRKAADARALLRLLAAPPRPGHRAAPAPALAVPRTWAFRQLLAGAGGAR